MRCWEEAKKQKGVRFGEVSGNQGRRGVRNVRGRESMEVCLSRRLDEVIEVKNERTTKER